MDLVGVPASPDVEREDQHVLRVVVADGPFEQRVQRPAVRADRHALEAAARRHVRLLAVGDVQRRVLRCLDARRGDRGFQQLAGGVGVEQERSELLTDPERPVGSDLQRLGVEVEAGEDAGSRVGTARRRWRRGQDVDRQVGQRRTGLIAHDLPRHVMVGIAEHGGGSDLWCGSAEVRVDPVHGQLIVGRVLAGTEAVVGQGPPRVVASGDHGAEALHRLVGEVGVAGRVVDDAVGCRVGTVLGGEEGADRRRAGPDGAGRQHAAIEQPGVLLAAGVTLGA